MSITKISFQVLLLFPLFSLAQTYSVEEQAILDVITEQTRSYFERDYETWLASHVRADYYTEHKILGWMDGKSEGYKWMGRKLRKQEKTI